MRAEVVCTKNQRTFPVEVFRQNVIIPKGIKGDVGISQAEFFYIISIGFHPSGLNLYVAPEIADNLRSIIPTLEVRLTRAHRAVRAQSPFVSIRGYSNLKYEIPFGRRGVGDIRAIEISAGRSTPNVGVWDPESKKLRLSFSGK